MSKSEADFFLSDLQERTFNIQASDELTSELLHPERLIIQFSDSQNSKVDIGSLCYTRRESLARDRETRSNICKLVDHSSLRKDRVELVRRIVDYLLQSANRDTTNATILKDVFSVFSWADKNSYCGFLGDVETAAGFYRDYSSYLNYRILVENSLKPNSAGTFQRAAVFVLKTFFGEEEARYIMRKVPNIRDQKRDSPEAPDQKHLAIYVNVVKTLSQNLSSQLMAGSSFPFHLKFRGYETYLFHGPGCNIKTPYSVAPHHIYNFDEGRISTVEEHMEKASATNIKCSRDAVRDAQETLALSDAPFSEGRFRYVVLSLQCYAVMFQMITGVNPSQLVALRACEALDIVQSPIKREFTTIKFRAAGKKINITIGGKFGVRFLKEYLEFRAWVLNGLDFDYLFFEFSKSGKYSREPQKLRETFQTRLFYTKLIGKFLPVNFKNVSLSKMRASKSVLMHELGISPELVANSLQHSVQMNARHYAEISTSRQRSEFEKFWSSVNKAAQKFRLIDESFSKQNLIPTVTGMCDEYGKPNAIDENVPIKPNCSTQYGCLYCEHFCCHADRTDVHKLLSLKYVFNEVRNYSKDVKHSDDLLREICVRATVIVGEIGFKSEKHRLMVIDVEKQVFDLGILTPFWEARLSRYEQLGIVL